MITLEKNKGILKWILLILGLVLCIGVGLFLYLFYTKDTVQEKFLKIGYNKEEITELRENLSTNELNEIANYSYLSFIIELLQEKEYNSEKLLDYINYIQKLDIDYNLDMIVYLVNHNISYPYSEKLVNIINSKYYVSSRLDRYMSYQSDDIKTIITNANSNLDYEFYTNIKQSDTTKGILLIVNKYYYLEKDYYYGELVKMDKAYDNKSNSWLNSIAYEAFKQLVDDAEKEGFIFVIIRHIVAMILKMAYIIIINKNMVLHGLINGVLAPVIRNIKLALP